MIRQELPNEFREAPEHICDFLKKFTSINLIKSIELLAKIVNYTKPRSDDAKNRLIVISKSLLPRLEEWKNTPQGGSLVAAVSSKLGLKEFCNLYLESLLKKHKLFEKEEKPIEKLYEYIDCCQKMILDADPILEKLSKLESEIAPGCTYSEFCDYLISFYDADTELLDQTQKSIVNTIKSEYDFLITYKKCAENLDKPPANVSPFIIELASTNLSLAIQLLVKITLADKKVLYTHILKTYCFKNNKLTFEKIPEAEKDEFLVQAYRAKTGVAGLTRHPDLEGAFARTSPKAFVKLLNDIKAQLSKGENLKDKVCVEALEKLDELIASTQTGAVPQSLKETQAYLEKQRIALVHILSIVPAKILKEVSLHCMKDYLNDSFNAESSHSTCSNCEIHFSLLESISLSKYYHFVQSDGSLSEDEFELLLNDHPQKLFDLFERMPFLHEQEFLKKFKLKKYWTALTKAKNSEAKDKFLVAVFLNKIANLKDLNELSPKLWLLKDQLKNPNTLDDIYAAYIIKCHEVFDDDKEEIKDCIDSFFDKLSQNSKDQVIAKIIIFTKDVNKGLGDAKKIQDNELQQSSLIHLLKLYKNCEIEFATLNELKKLIQDKEQFDAVLTDIIRSSLRLNGMTEAMLLARCFHSVDAINNMDATLEQVQRSTVYQGVPPPLY